MKNTIEKKNRNSKMVDISLIYRPTLGQYVDLWNLSAGTRATDVLDPRRL